MSLPGLSGIGGLASSSTGELVAIADRSIVNFDSTSAEVTYRLSNSGISQKGLNATFSTLETWLKAGAAGDYQARVTAISGEGLTSGTIGTWETLSTTREWARLETASVTSTAVFLVEIRLTAAPFTVLDSATITLSATVF
jgi:hypothetical protein